MCDVPAVVCIAAYTGAVVENTVVGFGEYMVRVMRALVVVVASGALVVVDVLALEEYYAPVVGAGCCYVLEEAAEVEY